ncbi:MAG: cupin domain-containing protein [Nitrospirota bacterium]
MVIKHYADVKPDAYAGAPEGVEMREMITDRDGAPRFAMRVFDVKPGAGTPFHTHEWEHEVYILKGTGRVRTENGDTPFAPGDSVYIAPNEKHGFIADPSAPVQFICVIPAKNQCRL